MVCASGLDHAYLGDHRRGKIPSKLYNLARGIWFGALIRAASLSSRAASVESALRLSVCRLDSIVRWGLSRDVLRWLVTSLPSRKVLELRIGSRRGL